MNEILATALRIAGVGLIALAAVHIPIARHLNWNQDSARLTPVNAAVFRVHALFICVVLVMMALPCLFEPSVFLEPSRAGAWMSWSFAGFWAIRLYCQWFVYERTLWTGRRFETAIHWLFSFVWGLLTTLFATCGLWQGGWRP
jgi:hypothetical protein